MSDLGMNQGNCSMLSVACIHVESEKKLIPMSCDVTLCLVSVRCVTSTLAQRAIDHFLHTDLFSLRTQALQPWDLL